jgi:hypothetical protein
MTRTFLQLIGFKTNQTSFLCGNRIGHDKTELILYL